MSKVRAVPRIVYFSPTRKRHFLSKRGAIRAEAVALIRLRYPTEKAEYDEIGCTYLGFHWTELPNHEKLLRRVMRLVCKATEGV